MAVRVEQTDFGPLVLLVPLSPGLALSHGGACAHDQAARAAHTDTTAEAWGIGLSRATGVCPTW